MVWPPTFAQGKTMRGRRRGACVLRVPSVAKSQHEHPGARRAARKTEKRQSEKIELRPLPGATTVVPVPLFPEKHREEDTHGKHGAHGHGSQLGGTVSNKVSKCRNTVRCVQVAQASKFLQVAIWVYLKGLPVHLARHLGRLRVSPRDQAVACLHACLLVATLLTTGPVVVRLAEKRDDNLSRT